MCYFHDKYVNIGKHGMVIIVVIYIYSFSNKQFNFCNDINNIAQTTIIIYTT